MTETTDIKALRAETWQLHTMQDAMDFSNRLLDLLEAERQRGDGLLKAKHAVSDAYVRLRQILGAMNPPELGFEALTNFTEQKAKELASLRGTQDPIYQVETTVEKDEAGELISIDWRDVPKEVAERAFEEYGLLVRKVFTYQTKPVVVLKPLPTGNIHSDRPIYMLDVMQAVRSDDIAAIEASGGLVCTSDERLMADMSSIVFKGGN